MVICRKPPKLRAKKIKQKDLYANIVIRWQKTQFLENLVQSCAD